jgi:hypothetical protein
MGKGAGDRALSLFKAASHAADNPDVTATISPQIRVFAVIGVIVAAALGLFLFISARSVDTTGTLSSPTAPKRPSATPSKDAPAGPVRSKPQPTPFRTPRSGFPTAVDRAFRKHKVVVLVVYMPGSSVDALVRKEARAGAIRSGAGYVPVNALNSRVAGQLVAKTGVLPDPAVVVVRRPGVVATTLGATDRETVAQAVAEARRS